MLSGRRAGLLLRSLQIGRCYGAGALRAAARWPSAPEPLGIRRVHGGRGAGCPCLHGFWLAGPDRAGGACIDVMRLRGAQDAGGWGRCGHAGAGRGCWSAPAASRGLQRACGVLGAPLWQGGQVWSLMAGPSPDPLMVRRPPRCPRMQEPDHDGPGQVDRHGQVVQRHQGVRASCTAGLHPCACATGGAWPLSFSTILLARGGCAFASAAPASAGAEPPAPRAPAAPQVRLHHP